MWILERVIEGQVQVSVKIEHLLFLFLPGSESAEVEGHTKGERI